MHPESLHILISDFQVFISLYKRISLITRLFLVFSFSIVAQFTFWWTFIQILLKWLWSISKILKLTSIMFLLWLVTLILEIISRILIFLIIWFIVILLQILQTLWIFVYLKLLIKFLLDIWTTQTIWTWLLILYFSDWIQRNLIIILFILNKECHQIMPHLQWIFWFLRNISKLENKWSSKIMKKKWGLLLKLLSLSKDLI